MSDLRSKLKSGPLNEIYSYARWAKRRLTGERIETTGVYDPVPLSPDTLRKMADKMPAHGRRYFALALGYLGTDNAADLSRALACLRCAETLNFESPERLALYAALTLAKTGEPALAVARLEPCAPEEFTLAENALRTQLRDGSIAPLKSAPAADAVWDGGFAVLQQQERVDSLLVVGDEEARSAFWFPQARYFLAAPAVTGLTPEQVAQCGLRFAWGVGPAPQIALVKNAGVVCDHWLEIV